MAEQDAVYTKLYEKLTKCWEQLEEVDSFKLPTQDIINNDENEEKDVKENKSILFPCDQCDFECLERKDLVSHKSAVHKKLSCDKCNFRTNFKRYLSTHKDRHHGSNRGNLFDLLKCPTCEFETNSAQYLNTHINSMHNKQTRYKCSLCEYKHFRRQNVEYHQKIKHINEEFRVLVENCQECQNSISHDKCQLPKISEKRREKNNVSRKSETAKRFKTDDSLPNSKILNCGECSFKTKYKGYLRTHKERHHGLNAPQLSDYFKCSFCEFETRSNQYLNIHVDSKHKKKTRYKCNLCNYKHRRKQCVENHQKMKHVNEGYRVIDESCENCKDNIDHVSCGSWRSNIKRELKADDVSEIKSKENKEIELKCDICDYKTTSKRYLKNHTIYNHSTDTNVDGTDVFTCDSCEMQTNSKHYLRIHVDAIHNKTVRFKCNICDLATYRRKDMEDHQKVHHKSDKSSIITIGCKQCENESDHSQCRFARRRDESCPRRYKQTFHRKIKKIYKDIVKTGKDDVIFSCKECEFKTRNTHTMENHKKAIHMDIVRFSCGVCAYKSYQQHHVRDHQLSNHPDQDCKVIRIGCLECETGKEHFTCKVEEEVTTETGGVMKKVLTYQYSRKIKRYCCEKCGEARCTKQAVSVHIQKVHEGEKCKVLGVGCKLCEINQWHNVCNFGTNLKARPVQENSGDNQNYKKLLPCGECPFETRGKNSLKHHMENIHLGIRRYSCTICSFKAYNKQTVREHQTHNHEKTACSIVGIGCSYCEKGVSHIKCIFESSEKERSEDVFACKECPFKTHRKDILCSHKESVHEGILRYFCGLCDMKSYYRQSVIIHHTRFHKDLQKMIKRVGCAFCEKNEDHNNCSTGQQNPLKTKAKTKVQESLVATCKMCFIKCKKRGELRKHYKTQHKDQFIYSCDSCNYGSNWKANVKTHKESKHLNITHTCDVCGYKSNWNTQFLEHRRDKHGIFMKKSKFNSEEMMGSLCDQCGFTTDDLKLLLIHRKEHLTYNCKECNYFSKTSTNLRVHIQSKHGRTLTHKESIKEYKKI